MSIQQHLSEFDDVVRICLSDILGSPLGDKEWHQATLSVSAGGAGLRSAQKHAPAAYVSSVLSSTDLVCSICKSESVTHMPLMSAIELLNGETNSEDTVESLNGATQKSLSFKIDQRSSQLFIDSLTNDRDKARFSSVLLQHSGDFLNTIPSPILGLHLDKREFIFALKFCLGMQLYSQDGTCPSCLGLGDHALPQPEYRLLNTKNYKIGP